MEDGGTIFGRLVQGKLVEMNAGPYISEDVLQKYQEEHPKLLAGEQIDDADRAYLRRWVLRWVDERGQVRHNAEPLPDQECK